MGPRDQAPFDPRHDNRSRRRRGNRRAIVFLDRLSLNLATRWRRLSIHRRTAIKRARYVARNARRAWTRRARRTVASFEPVASSRRRPLGRALPRRVSAGATAHWVDWVNQPQTEAEADAVRISVQRAHFGGDAWRKRATALLGLEHTQRPPGRPRKTVKTTPVPFSSSFRALIAAPGPRLASSPVQQTENQNCDSI